MRVGLFGGTFDPPTTAHLIAAEWAREALELDEVWFIPAAQNPLKETAPETDSRTRLELLEKALEGKPGFRVEPCEIERAGRSYTYDTVSYLKNLHPDVDFTLVVGADAFASFPKWHRFADLIDTLPVAVFSRPGAHFEHLDESITTRIKPIPFPELEISSTLVRERAGNGLSIHYLVPPGVERIIRERNLYRER